MSVPRINKHLCYDTWEWFKKNILCYGYCVVFLSLQKSNRYAPWIITIIYKSIDIREIILDVTKFWSITHYHYFIAYFVVYELFSCETASISSSVNSKHILNVITQQYNIHQKWYISYILKWAFLFTKQTSL